MQLVRNMLASFLLLFLLETPLMTNAAPFGGRVGIALPCWNAAIWAQVTSPRGGLYIYSLGGTRKYPKGPPALGKWVLGLSGIPYFCIVSIAPLLPLPGLMMTMEASS